MIGVVIAVLVAALVYWLAVPVLGLPGIVGVVAAICVVVASVPHRGRLPW